MGEQGFGDGFASAAQMIDGAFEIQGADSDSDRPSFR